ncbi:MAG: hypothetical protein RL391_186 [Actinomycetota bacterium]|jgi:hypothetical protein
MIRRAPIHRNHSMAEATDHDSSFAEEADHLSTNDPFDRSLGGP